MTTTVVPFGKYKGQPIEALAQDREYCDWLAGQDWFRTRYTTIHTLIVNNFAEPHETPEHNALQVLFTDPAWVTAFVWAYLGPTWWADLLTRDLTRGHHTSRRAIAELDKRIADCQQHGDEWEMKQIVSLRTSANTIHDAYCRRHAWLTSGIVARVEVTELAFEQRGADVAFRAYVGATAPKEVCFHVPGQSAYADGEWFDSLGGSYTVRVECKPTLGDDYPAVLRQMIAQGPRCCCSGAGTIRASGRRMSKCSRSSAPRPSRWCGWPTSTLRRL